MADSDGNSTKHWRERDEYMRVIYENFHLRRSESRTESVSEVRSGQFGDRPIITYGTAARRVAKQVSLSYRPRSCTVTYVTKV